MKKKIEVAHGWGIKVGGPRPYLVEMFRTCKETIIMHCLEPYHRVVKVVIVPYTEWKRLKKMEREVEKNGLKIHGR